MGLCPQCLLSMALEDEESETLHGSSPGGILGERYQIREVLGRGGMGEVYRAFDLKLRVDVALKAVRPELSSSEKARELLRQEVRSAREVLSPNVCRIFDLVVEEGRELVSMEYIDGTTLAETASGEKTSGAPGGAGNCGAVSLGARSDPRSGIGASGLQAGERDADPRGAGGGDGFWPGEGPHRARESDDSGNSCVHVSGAVARRAGRRAVGRVLGGSGSGGDADVGTPSCESGMRCGRSPPRVPEGPWAPVLRQALSSDRESRHPTARALARALDEVTHRLPGFEDKHPYPGLASFTQEDAEYFFGREMEVEAVWKKLKRPRLLALIGPSGAGKSSFLRAGLLPTLPPVGASSSRPRGIARSRRWRRRLLPGVRGRHGGDPVVPGLRERHRGSPAVEVAPEERARSRDRGPVRRALHAEPSGGAGGVRYLIRKARSGSGRARSAVASRRLPFPLPEARGTEPGVLGADAPGNAEPERS